MLHCRMHRYSSQLIFFVDNLCLGLDLCIRNIAGRNVIHVNLCFGFNRATKLVVSMPWYIEVHFEP